MLTSLNILSNLLGLV